MTRAERERDQQGQYVETITAERVVGVLADADVPFMATGDVADALGCSREAARLKLTDLADEGHVERRNVRGAVVVWWLADEEGSGLDRDREYLKSFGKYAGTNVAETAAAVGERFDRDLRERRGRRMGGDR